MEKHIHIKIKEGAIATFSKKPSKKTLEMVKLMVERMDKSDKQFEKDIKESKPSWSHNEKPRF